MRYDGSRATVRARFGRESAIEVSEHASGRTERIPIPETAGGHGGGDPGVVGAFLAAVRDGTPGLTAAVDSLESHILAFAAEEARVSGAVVDMRAFRSAALSTD